MRITDLAPVAIILVVAGIALTIGADVMNDVTGSMSTGGHAWLAGTNATIGVGRLAKWLPTIALVCAAAVIIGVVFQAFSTGRQ